MAMGLAPAMMGGGGLSTPGGSGGTVNMPLLVSRTHIVMVPSALLAMNASFKEGWSTMATGTDPVFEVGAVVNGISAPEEFWLNPSTAFVFGPST